MAVNLIKNKEHLTMEGLRKIVSIRASINWGLPLGLKTVMVDITPVERPIVLNYKVPDPAWLAGFTSGEGSFMIRICKSKTKIGSQVLLTFVITQHERD